MYNVPQPFFLLCPSSTTFPPSKANHNPCTTFLSHLFYSVHPLQPSLHRKPIITHVQPSLAIFSTFPILYNLPSIESQSWPMYNIPWPSFLPCPSSTTFPPSKAHHYPRTTFLGHFSALLIPTYSTNILPFVHRKPIMTRVPPSLAQLTPLHVTFYQCIFLLTVLCDIYSSLFKVQAVLLSTDAD